MTYTYYLVVETEDALVPVAQFNFRRKLKEDERRKIAQNLSGSGKFRWGIGFGLKRLGLGKKVRGATMMSEEELKERGIDPSQFPVIQVPMVLG